MWELSDSFVVLRESEAFQGAGDVDLAVHLPRLRGGGWRTYSHVLFGLLKPNPLDVWSSL